MRQLQSWSTAGSTSVGDRTTGDNDGRQVANRTTGGHGRRKVVSGSTSEGDGAV